jgi:hypothetical protein
MSGWLLLSIYVAVAVTIVVYDAVVGIPGVDSDFVVLFALVWPWIAVVCVAFSPIAALLWLHRTLR